MESQKYDLISFLVRSSVNLNRESEFSSSSSPRLRAS